MGLQIIRAKIDGFGTLVQREYNLAPGLCLLLGKNETGKSTWVAFVKAVLFGLNPSEAEPWKPWQPGAPFAGEVTLLRPGSRITIRREFETNEIVWTETDAATGATKDELKGNVSPRARRAIREEYDKRLAALLGFSSPAIFSSCIMAQQGRLREMDAGELGPELRTRLTGGEGTDYEVALKELDDRFLEITNEELKRGSKDRLLEEKHAERLQKEEELQQARAEWSRIGECQARLEKAKLRVESLAKEVAADADLIQALDELDKAHGRIEELEKQYSLLMQQLRQIEETDRRLAAAESDLARFQAEARAPANASERIAESQRLCTALEAADGKAVQLKEAYGVQRRRLIIGMAVGGAIVTALIVLALAWHPALAAALVLLVGVGVWATLQWKGLEAQRRAVEDAAREEEGLTARLVQLENELRRVWPDFQADRASEYLKGLSDYAVKRAGRDGIAAVVVGEEKRKNLLQSKDLLERELAVARQQTEMIFRKSPPLRKMDAAEQLRLRSRHEANARDLTAAREELRNAELALAGCRGPDTSPQQLEEEIRALAEEEKRLAYRRDVLRLARDVLRESVEEYRSNYIPTLERLVTERFCAITSDPGRQIGLDDSLTPTVRWPASEPRDAAVLSAGGLDQLYFSMRLAAMSLLSQGGGQAGADLPLILDDPFANFDDDRFDRAMKMLRSLSDRHQVILLTHDERARKYAERVLQL